MVRLEILVKINPEKRFEFTQTFDVMMQPDHRPRDCIKQLLFEKTGEPNAFLWVEDWKNTESLEVYTQGQRFKSMLGAVEVLGSLTKIWNFTLNKGVV